MSVTLTARLTSYERIGGNPDPNVTYCYTSGEYDVPWRGESLDKYIITGVNSAELTGVLNSDTSYGNYYRIAVMVRYGNWEQVGYFDAGSGLQTRGTLYNFVLTASEELKIKLTNTAPTNIGLQVLNGHFNIAGGTYSTNQPYLDLKTAIRFSKATSPTSVVVSKNPVAPSEKVNLSWSGAKPGTRNPIKEYEVYRSTTPSGTYSYIGKTAGTSMEVTASSALAGYYYYKVKAIGESSFSEYDGDISTAYATLFSSPPSPTKPEGVALTANNVTPGATSVLSWNASTADPSNPVSGYQVQRSANNSTWTDLGAAQTARTMNVTAQTAHNTSYFYRVIAVGKYSNSTPSDSIELKTVVGALAPPSGVQANGATSSTVSPATVTQVTWSAVENATNNALTGYIILSSSTPTGGYTTAGEVGASVLTFDVTAPTTEQTVYYRVVAKGNLANSEPSSFASIVVSLKTADASTFTLDATNVYAGENIVLNITSNTDKSHKVKIDFLQETSGVIEMEAEQTTLSFPVPLTWLNQIPDSSLAKGAIVVETYDGSVLKGTRSSEVTILVPLDVKPTLAFFEATRVDNDVPPEWGVYVVSKSQVDLAMGEGAGAYGSTVTGYRLMGAGMNVSSALPITRRSPVLPSTQNLFTATVMDSRGRSNNYTVTIPAFAYSPPTLGVESFRCNQDGVETTEGKYGSVKATSTFSPVDGKNNITIRAEYRVLGSQSAYTSLGNLVSGTPLVFGGNLDINNYYEIKYTVTDSLGTVVVFIDDISTAKFILHFKEGGDGLGVGGTSSDPRLLDVHWGMRVREGLTVDGDTNISQELYVGGDVNIDGVINNPHLANTIEEMGDKISSLENSMSSYSFIMNFNDLEGIDTNGIWNTNLKRIEC